MDKIYIKVDKKTGMIYLENTVIGRDKENLQQELIFSFENGFVLGSPRLEYKIGNNRYHIPMERIDETYVVPIKNILTVEGKIEMQLVITQVAQNEEIPVFKSNVFYMYCDRSINAQEEPMDDYEYWLDVIEEKLAEVDEALDELDNVDIDASKIGNTATVSITNKEGITKSVEIYDGENGTDGIDGKDAKINGVNTLSIEAGTNISIDQEGSTLTINSTGGSGGTTDYSDLTNKPSINNITLSGNKTSSDLGLGTYSKPSGGIPSTDLASAVQTSLGKADTAIQSSDLTNYVTNTENSLLVADKNDRASQIIWTAGYRVARTNTNILTEGSGYSVADIEVKKGDKITIEAGTGRAQPLSISIFSKKVLNGSSYNYRPLIPFQTASYYEYIATEDCTITLSIRTGVYFKEAHWYRVEAYGKDIQALTNSNIYYPYNYYRKMMTALSANPMQASKTTQKPLVLVHGSDIHGSAKNADELAIFMNKYKDCIDDVIITGDLTSGSFATYTDFLAQDSYKNFLLAIGNHDVYDHNGDATSHGVSYDNPEYWATPVEKYNQYFAPNIANWNVVQPANASSLGLCYYYKDYSLSSGATIKTVTTIRLIVLDAMAYDAAQHTWLSNTLTDARINNIPVVIAEHFPPTESDTDDTYKFNTPFTSFMTGMELKYGLSYLGYRENNILYTAASLVDEFINNDGEFTCWLCGHLHYGVCGTLKSHPNQIYIAVDTTNSAAVWKSTPRDFCDGSFNLVNAVSIDTYNKVIKVGRIGANYDDRMRIADTMCIDYANRVLISDASDGIVTEISNTSDNFHYPSAKCVYDLVGDVESILTTLTTGSGV